MKEHADGPLLVRISGTAAVLTINRPDQRNALNEPLLHLLRDTIADAAADPAVRSVIITGAGDRAFCAGADIRQMQEMGADWGREWTLLGQDVFLKLEALPKPVIAAINGIAVGGGCELALACDFRFMAEDARLGQPEVKLGLIPGWGGTQRLPRIVGASLAKDLIFSGRLMASDEALRVHLVNGTTPAGHVVQHALTYAAQFDQLPPLAVGFAKQAIDRGFDLHLIDGSLLEVELFTRAFETEDKAEGLGRFPREACGELQRPLDLARSTLHPDRHIGLMTSPTLPVDRPIRVLVAKPGLDGHDRGAKVVARALRDAGMEVIYTGIRQTPDMIAEAALQEDVDVVGLSIHSGAHMDLFPRILEAMRQRGIDDALVFAGGIIPDADVPVVKRMGITGVFGPGASLEKIVDEIRAACPRPPRSGLDPVRDSKVLALVAFDHQLVHHHRIVVRHAFHRLDAQPHHRTAVLTHRHGPLTLRHQVDPARKERTAHLQVAAPLELVKRRLAHHLPQQ